MLHRHGYSSGHLLLVYTFNGNLMGIVNGLCFSFEFYLISCTTRAVISVSDGLKLS